MEPLPLLLEGHSPLLPGVAPPEASLLLPGLSTHHLSHFPGSQVQSQASHQLSLRSGQSGHRLENIGNSPSFAKVVATYHHNHNHLPLTTLTHSVSHTDPNRK